MTGYKCGCRKIDINIDEQEFYIEINNTDFSMCCRANAALLYGNSNRGFCDLSYEEQLDVIIGRFDRLQITDWYVYKNHDGNRKELMYFSPIANARISEFINNESRLLYDITDGECDLINEELRNYLIEKSICSLP